MNVNRVELNAELALKEEAALKCVQFATQYLLKKAEYRLLNPLHTSLYSLPQLNNQSQLMAQLNLYSNPKLFLSKPIPLKKPQNYSQSKQLKPQNNQQTLKKPPKFQQQFVNYVSSQSDSDSNHVLIQRTDSQLLYQRHSQQSSSSKKSKTKFEKVVKSNKPKRQKQTQTFPLQTFNFKKIKATQTVIKNVPQTQNKQKKPLTLSSDSQDSFDNIPFVSSQKPKELNMGQSRESIRSQDFDSYHSSILQEKIHQIDIVSEHQSESELSYLSERDILEPELKQKKQNEKGQLMSQRIQELDNKSKISVVKDLRKSKQFIKRQNSYQAIQNDERKSNNFIQNGSQVHQFQAISENNQEQQRDEARKQLLKLQSFDVQQEMLFKKLTKIWSQQPQTLKKVRNLKWDYLQLPKPSMKFNKHLYAQVIQ